MRINIRAKSRRSPLTFAANSARLPTHSLARRVNLLEQACSAFAANAANVVNAVNTFAENSARSRRTPQKKIEPLVRCKRHWRLPRLWAFIWRFAPFAYILEVHGVRHISLYHGRSPQTFTAEIRRTRSPRTFGANVCRELRERWRFLRRTPSDSHSYDIVNTVILIFQYDWSQKHDYNIFITFHSNLPSLLAFARSSLCTTVGR